MTQATHQPTTHQPTPGPTPTRVGRSYDVRVALVAAAAAGAGWVAWTAAGADLVVRAGTGTRPVGLVSVLVTAVVVGVVGGGLLRFLERRTPRALTRWTWLALGVLAISLLGPLGATTAAGVLALASLHLVVGAVVIGAQHLLRRDRVA